MLPLVGWLVVHLCIITASLCNYLYSCAIILKVVQFFVHWCITTASLCSSSSWLPTLAALTQCNQLQSFLCYSKWQCTLEKPLHWHYQPHIFFFWRGGLNFVCVAGLFFLQIVEHPPSPLVSMSLGKNQPFEEVSWHIYTFAPRCALCMSRLLRSHGPRITWPVSRDPRRRGQNKAGGDVSLLSQKGHQGSWGKTHLGPGTSSGWRRRRRRWPLVPVGVPCQRYRQGHPDLAHWLSWGHHWSCIVAQSTRHNRQSGGGMNSLQPLTLLTLSLFWCFLLPHYQHHSCPQNTV